MTLPLQLLFYIDPASLKSGAYRQVLQHYATTLRLSDAVDHGQMPRPLAYVELTDAEKSLLPDCIDLCYELGIAPLANDGTQVKERGVNHLFHFIDRAEAQAAPYTLLIRGGGLIQPAGHPLINVLHTAVTLLHQGHQITTVGFQGLFSFPPPQPLNPIVSAVQRPKWPMVLRTRDLYLASLLSIGNGGQPEQLLSAFSYSPARHVVFNQSVATCT